MAVVVRKFEKTDDFSAFTCGNEALDLFIKQFAKGNQHRFGVTYVAVDEDGTMLGYLTVVASSVEREKVGGKGPSSWPVLLIARLAVRSNIQKGGIGTMLMQRAFELALEQHLTIGCAAVIVDAKPGAIDYYRDKFMFVEMVDVERDPDKALPMFLEIKTLVKAAEAAAKAATETSRNT